jgi:predicted transcriptional regulator of viral defense system
MNDCAKIIEMAGENNGMVTASSVSKAGLQRRALAECVTAGRLIKGARGVYFLSGPLEDEFAIWQHTYSQGIFSGSTALYLLKKTDRIPYSLYMTFPKGYNVSAAKQNGIKCKIVVAERYDLGVQDVLSPYGNVVRCYNIERTLCDIVRGDDVQSMNHAFKEYARSDAKDIALLMHYARILHVEKRVRNYMEILL